MTKTLKALFLRRDADIIRAETGPLEEESLPEGDVTVAIEYSSLNYKDGLILKGLGGMVENYPHIPGIDFAGVVERSETEAYEPGDRVILTGWRVGERHWGGYAGMARVKSAWLVPLPEKLTTRQAMALGTAGLTAGLCLIALEKDGLTPKAGEVLVTGASGGVGSLAVALCAASGYEVAASTGRKENHDYLRDLGAQAILEREALSQGSGRPLESERWAGVIDTVGGSTLATALSQLKYSRAAAACGLAGGAKLETTVIPFLLRGVRLIGIDSVMRPLRERRDAWERLAREMPLEKLEAISATITLSDVARYGEAILKGKVRGRIIVDVNALNVPS